MIKAVDILLLSVEKMVSRIEKIENTNKELICKMAKMEEELLLLNKFIKQFPYHDSNSGAAKNVPLPRFAKMTNQPRSVETEDITRTHLDVFWLVQ